MENDDYYMECDREQQMGAADRIRRGVEIYDARELVHSSDS